MPLLPPGCVFSVDRAIGAMPGPMPRHHTQRCWDAQDSLGSIPASLPPSWPEIARRSANARRRLHRPPYQPRCRSTNARYRPCGFAHTLCRAREALLPARAQAGTASAPSPSQLRCGRWAKSHRFPTFLDRLACRSRRRSSGTASDADALAWRDNSQGQSPLAFAAVDGIAPVFGPR